MKSYLIMSLLICDKVNDVIVDGWVEEQEMEDSANAEANVMGMRNLCKERCSDISFLFSLWAV